GCWPSIWKRNLTDLKTRNAVTIPLIHGLCFGHTGESKKELRSIRTKLRNQGNFHFDDRRIAPLCHGWLKRFGLTPVPRLSARLPIFFNVVSRARNSFGLASAKTLLISAACLRKIGAINSLPF